MKAQMLVLEAIFVAAWVIIAILLINTFILPRSTTEENPVAQLEVLGSDALRSLDKAYIEDSAYHNSLLTKYIFTDDKASLSKFLNVTLSNLVSYRIWLYNASAHETSLWYPENPINATNNVATAHRIIVYNGYVYDVKLEMWYK